MSTKKELIAKLRELGVPFRAKAPKEELEKLAAAAQKPQERAEPAEAQDKPAAKRARKEKQPAAKPERKPSTKAIIRSLFPKVGSKVSAEKLFAACPVQEATVVTMIADLKNPKYCGPEGVIVVTRNDGHFERTA